VAEQVLAPRMVAAEGLEDIDLPCQDNKPVEAVLPSQS
jgi:hypothetical protein